MSSNDNIPPQEHPGAEDSKNGSAPESDATPSLTSTEADGKEKVTPSQKTPATSSASGTGENSSGVLNTSLRTESNILAIENASQNLLRQKIEEALVEVHLSWVGEESAHIPVSHRSLKRYSVDLAGVVKVMRSYAYNDEENEEAVVIAVYNYICKGLSHYL